MENQSGGAMFHLKTRRILTPETTAAGLLALFVATSGCREQAMPPAQPPRPVSYITLELTKPKQASRLTGSTESWKREDLGFEVGGRLLRVVEPGANIVGNTYDESGKVLTQGTVLAEIDDERYQIALSTATSAVETAKNELETVIPAQLKKAQAVLDKADKDLVIYTNLVRMKSAPQQRLDLAEAAQKAAKADVATVEALIATKRLSLKTLQTQVEQAKVSIRNCILRSPFTGQIARVHVIPGGYVLPSQPVITVQMMDPMKVNIAVSPATDARINQNDFVRVYMPGGEKLDGVVYLKDTFADPATRTFLVTLLVRNRRIVVGIPKAFEKKGVAQCRNLWKLEKEQLDAPGNYYAEAKAIQKDAQGEFVWKASSLSVDQLYEDFDPVLTVKKVRVTVGEGRIPILQVFKFRELTDVGELDPAKDVIVGGITGKPEDGGQVVLVRERWVSRPGDVVRVGLKGQDSPAGFYVPEEAIRFDGQNYHIAIAKDSKDGTQEVSIVPVRLAETAGAMRRIEGDLKPGMKVIAEGVHYLTDGESVRTVDAVAVGP